MKSKRLLIGLTLAPLVLGAASWVLFGTFVDHKLTDEGWQWRERSRSLLDFTWKDLKRNSIEIKIAKMVPFEKKLLLKGVDFQIDQNAPQQTNGDSINIPSGFEIEAEEISLSFGDHFSIHNLEGSIWPTLNLRSEQYVIEKTDGSWKISGQHQMASERLKGKFDFSLSYEGNRLGIEASSKEMIIHWPTLSPKQVKIEHLKFSGSKNNGPAKGRIEFHKGSPIDIETDWMPHKKNWVLQASIDHFPYDDMLHLLDVPEKNQLTMSGELTGTVHVAGPELSWRPYWSTTPIETTGNILNPKPLATGKTAYKPFNSDTIRELGPMSKEWIRIEDMGYFPNAVIAAEDGHFWSHPGYNPSSIREALNTHLSEGKPLRGGSSITQQLAKNLYLSGERSLYRKIRELGYALELERLLGKKQILNLYLNAIEFGPEIYGIKAAAMAYFVKSPDSLTALEAAFLASILPSPRKHYTRIKNKNRIGLKRTHGILKVMRQRGYLSQEEYDEAMASQLTPIPP